jgi:hypothetical protein
MRVTVTVGIYLAWVIAYLAIAHWTALFRWRRSGVLGDAGTSQYRADKDPILVFVVFCAGIILALMAYLATKALGNSM